MFKVASIPTMELPMSPVETAPSQPTSTPTVATDVTPTMDTSKVDADCRGLSPEEINASTVGEFRAIQRSRRLLLKEQFAWACDIIADYCHGKAYFCFARGCGNIPSMREGYTFFDFVSEKLECPQITENIPVANRKVYVEDSLEFHKIYDIGYDGRCCHYSVYVSEENFRNINERNNSSYLH